MVTPGYLVGKIFNAAQVGTFAVISIFALINALLIRAIAKKLGASDAASTLASLVFLFATPAFSYAVTLYQHHITVFLMLSSIFILLKWRSVWPLLFVWILVAGSIPVDYPNIFMFLPIGIYALGRIFEVKKVAEGLKLNLKLAGILTFVGILIPVAFFLWTNNLSYGDPLQLAGTLQSVKDFDEAGNPIFSFNSNKENNGEILSQPTTKKEKTALGFFKTRNMLHGGNIQLVSNERGILWYAPIILLGILGIPLIYKKNKQFVSLLLSIIGVNILLYTMWGDPWGGWAFGSRYLIPTYAIMSVFLAIALTEYRKKKLALVVFFILASYSVAVNTLGALTTNTVPPKVEAVALEPISGRKEHYTYLRNWEFLMKNKSKSFVYQAFAKDYLTAPQYYYIITASIILVMSGQLVYLYIDSRKENKK